MTASRYGDPTGEEPANESFASEADTIERYRDRLRLFAARRLGDWAAAEDVAQETIRRALEALRAGRIESPAAFPGFLYQIAIYVCLHRSRSAGRERRALDRFGASVEKHSAQDPLASLISGERSAQVRQGLERLNPEDRQVLTMTYQEELSTAKIGRRLKLTEGNVRVRRHRALKRLAELLGVTPTTDRGLKD